MIKLTVMNGNDDDVDDKWYTWMLMLMLNDNLNE